MPLNWHEVTKKLTSEFTRGVLTLSFGTAVAGILPVIGTFLMMKIYTPEEFGVLALYIGIYGICATVVTGRYELGIVLPQSNDDAVKLTYLSIFLALICCSTFYAFLIPFGGLVSHHFGYDSLYPYLLLIPVSVFLQALYQSLFYYSNRSRRFREMSYSKIVTSVFQVGSQILLGMGKVPFNGLIVGRLIGQLVGTTVFIKNSLELAKYTKSISIQSLREIGRRYLHFPKHLIFSHGIAALYAQIPLFFIANYFGEGDAGYYSIAMQIIVIPNLLISNAIGDVFRQRAAEDFNKNGHFREIFMKTVKSMAVFGIMPFALFAILAPYLFELYDQEWATAGIYARYLAISVFVSFIATPVDKAALITGNTRYILGWHLSFFISHILIASLALYMEFQILQYIFLVILIRTLHFMVELGFAFKFSKGNAKY